MKSRKFAAIAVSLTAALALVACNGTADTDTPDTATTDTAEAPAGDGGLIGVAMPTQTSERWIADGEAVKSGLEAAGYTVDLQFANDDIPTQSQQIDQMITKGA